MESIEGYSMTYIVSKNEVTQTVAPVVTPVSLIEAKAHLRVDGSDSDTLITTLIEAATLWVENYLQASLVQRTNRADVWGFASVFRLPQPPLVSITSIQYYTPDSPQVLTTLDSNFYRTDTGRGEIYMDVDAGNIPSVASRRDAVLITYVNGYGAGTSSPLDYAETTPAPIKAAILLQVSELFENRQINSELRLQELPTVTMLLAAYRIY
jgi:uncharacterized phiE125 gp8 family phage protein